FDVCEENVGAYFIARDQGHPITALPVFMHRRFRHGFVFINTHSGIKTPKDLVGRDVGGTNFMPAGNIWIRGVLDEHYGCPHRPGRGRGGRPAGRTRPAPPAPAWE